MSVTFEQVIVNILASILYSWTVAETSHNRMALKQPLFRDPCVQKPFVGTKLPSMEMSQHRGWFSSPTLNLPAEALTSSSRDKPSLLCPVWILDPQEPRHNVCFKPLSLGVICFTTTDKISSFLFLIHYIFSSVEWHRNSHGHLED